MITISPSGCLARSSRPPNPVSVRAQPPRRRLAWHAAVAVALLVTAAPSYAGTWDHPRGNAANTGFADVPTAAATVPAQTVPGLGRFAPGAGPVIGPDGMVYVGNFFGELRAIRLDGSQAWMRTLLRGQHIMASPVIGADGAIYVVGTKRERIRDHRGGGEVRFHTRYETTLYRFHSGGAMVWSSNFPGTNPASLGTGTAPAAPNIWRSGGTEVIIVPAEYPTFGGHDVRLAAFSTNGALLFTHRVTAVRYAVTGGSDWEWCRIHFGCFEGAGPPPDPFNDFVMQLGALRPAVAMFARGGEPVVVVADHYQNIVGYVFSPATGFQETFRKHLTNDARGIGMSSPVALRDGHSVLRGWGPGQEWLLFGGPHPINWSEVVLPKDSAQIPPTLTADGRIITLASAAVTVVRTNPRAEIARTAPMNLAGRLAPAAASRNHVFISTESALLTLDANNMQVAARFDWQDGGVSSPAIGADGRVYALAGDTLIMFPPPRRSCPRPVCPGDGDLDPFGSGPVLHSQDRTPNQPLTPVFHATPSLSSGGTARPGAMPK